MTILAAAAVLTIAMRSVIRPAIVALSAVARRVGDGDFRGAGVGWARDEIGELAARSTTMDITAHKAYTELATKNKELETALQSLQESRQRLELLEQLKGELSKFVPDAVKKLSSRIRTRPSSRRRPSRSRSSSSTSPATRSSPSSSSEKLNQLVQTYFLELSRDHPEPARRRERDGPATA